MDVFIDLQVNSESVNLPSEAQLTQWATAAVLADDDFQRDDAEISVVIVDAEEGRELNNEWRNKDYATNVLSFPSDLPAELNLPLLGDLVICAPVVEREAAEQGKTLESHWAHMIIHGTLHLLGYDHIEDDEAEVMETLETGIMQSLGFKDPYDPSYLNNLETSSEDKTEDHG
ncbi:rRNA maturation RNase YbeY [Parendozoicomonas haliclonae]|uniref:Endoribonuclease YbeY n=1 Tax=Parendozoicomonas haliclonae TaxID=1960125 RepID=A0A1X7AN58_9GAMM|nr:rRNA maturation RNase YbeY [Parendozoicomonas haliclonae]SMA49545.1 Endoribonuclease YbeY [Parendozoicomonas haliclonae]